MAKSFQVDTNGTLTTSLVSYWNLHSDSSDFWGSNNGTDTSVSYNASYGKVAGGAYYTGSAKTVVSSPSGYSAGGGPFSVAFWVKSSNSFSSQGLAINLNNTGNTEDWAAGFDNNSHGWTGVWNGSTGVGVDTAGTMNDGAWHLLIATYSGGTVTLYVDNSLVGTASQSQNIGVDILSLGANQAGTQELYGYLCEVGLWTKVLSSQERTDLYNGGAGQTMVLGGTTYARAASLSMMNNASRYATAQRVWQTARTATVTMMNAAARAASAVFHLPAHYARTASVNMMNAASRYATVVSRITVVWVRTASVTMMNAASRFASATRSFIIKIGSTIRWDFWTWD